MGLVNQIEGGGIRRRPVSTVSRGQVRVSPTAPGPTASPIVSGNQVLNATNQNRATQGRAPLSPAPTQPRITSNRQGSISRTSSYANSGPGPAPVAIQPTPTPSLEDFLGSDETYKTQKTAIDNAIADYLAQMQQQQGNYEGDYQNQLRDLGTARTQGLEDLTDDFAGRGLLRSGLYADADSDLRTDFTRRETDLGADRTKFLGDLETGKTNFTREQQLTEQRAKADAIARRAAMYGL